MWRILQDIVPFWTYQSCNKCIDRLKVIMNIFEFRNLLNQEDKKEKRKSFLRSLIRSVETGANGTLDYIVKKGSGKNRIAKSK